MELTPELKKDIEDSDHVVTIGRYDPILSRIRILVRALIRELMKAEIGEEWWLVDYQDFMNPDKEEGVVD